MRRAILLLFLLASQARPGDDRPARQVRDPALQTRINRAIDSGIAYLKSIQLPDGSWPYPTRAGPARDSTGGLTALALYALAASGVPDHDPATRKGLAFTEKNKAAYAPGATYGTYSASLLILALTRIDAKRYRGRIRVLAGRLVEAELANDMWTYRLRRQATSTRKGRRGRGRGGGGAPRGGRWRGAGDNSNSQFAILALWAAQAIAGAHTPDTTWKRVQRFYERTQLRDGGWSYRPPATPGGAAAGHPAMNAAGLVSYVYATAALLGGVKALDAARGSPVARKGVRLFRARWGWNFDNYYFVYALERVGTVLALPIEAWYLEGARVLVRNQHTDGSWRAMTRQGDDQHAYETSLALLFLSRATARSITPGGGPRRKAREHRDRVGLPDPAIPGNLERAFSYYLALDEKGRREAAADFGPAGTPVLGLLIAKLRDEREPVRAAAFDLLDRLVAKRFLFQADWPRTDREWMLAPIEAFWRAHRDDLRWDARRNLFVSR